MGILYIPNILDFWKGCQNKCKSGWTEVLDITNIHFCCIWQVTCVPAELSWAVVFVKVNFPSRSIYKPSFPVGYPAFQKDCFVWALDVKNAQCLFEKHIFFQCNPQFKCKQGLYFKCYNDLKKMVQRGFFLKLNHWNFLMPVITFQTNCRCVLVVMIFNDYFYKLHCLAYCWWRSDDL